jgi:hypothetical protein
MKCNNCGFSNKPELSRCEKCNSVLSESSSSSSQDYSSPQSKDSSYQGTIKGQQASGGFIDQESIGINVSNENIAGTLRAEQAREPFIDRPVSAPFVPIQNQSLSECPYENCKYPLAQGTQFCPQCNRDVYQLENSKSNPTPQNSNFKGTIDPYSRKGFSLRPIINGEPAKAPLVFDTSSAVLNRENTIKDNMTITSKEQAEIKLENGEWYIVDKSEKQTTFVRPSSAMKLNKGDIILLGDTKFIFE